MVIITKYFIVIIFAFLSINGVYAQDVKCGTSQQMRQLWNAKLSKIDLPKATRPVLHKSVLTPNGKIRIHFDTSGTNQPAMVNSVGSRIPNSYQQFIDTLRIILDSVWISEIQIFGFNEPPPDSNRGGGNEYDFYVLELGGGLFGQTDIESDLPVGATKANQQYASFIQIDNDFGVDYRTRGIPAVMATTAHEFHHAIQVGGSGVWEVEQFYFYELCAEAMENTVFRDAKDYLFDVKTYYDRISSITLFQTAISPTTAGYERAIFGMFLMKKYGTVIMKELWNEMRIHRPIPALKNVLALRLSTIEKEFSNFALWNFYTNYRSDGVKYFQDASLFPPLSFSSQITLNVSEDLIQKTSNSMVTNFIRVAKQPDTAFFVISNTNLLDAETNAGNVFPFQLKVSPFAAPNFQKINNSIYAQFNVPDPNNWNFALSTDTNAIQKPKTFDAAEVFPNPYRVNGNNLLFISMDEENSENSNVELNVYSSSSDLIFSGQPQFTNLFGKRFAVWNGKNSKGNIVSSGVYFYILSKNAGTLKGKFAVIR